MSKWTTYNVNLLSSIPNQPGVYAIYHEGQLVYIGQSEHLYDRIKRHELITPNREICSVKVKVLKKLGEWRMAEFRLIRRLKPSLNKDKVFNRKELNVADNHSVTMILKYSAKGWTASRIAKLLNEKGLKDLKGRVWSAVSIHAVQRKDERCGNLWETIT